MTGRELLPNCQDFFVAFRYAISSCDGKEIHVRRLGIQAYRLLIGFNTFFWWLGKEQDSSQVKITLGEVWIESDGTLGFDQGLHILPFPGEDRPQYRVRQRQRIIQGKYSCSMAEARSSDCPWLRLGSKN